MRLILSIAVVVTFLVYWGITWRRQPKLAFGIFIGLGAAWAIAAALGSVSLDRVPLWLPPLPFAVVAVTLFVFGILAWVWDDKKDSQNKPGSPDSRPPHQGH